MAGSRWMIVSYSIDSSRTRASKDFDMDRVTYHELILYADEESRTADVVDKDGVNQGTQSCIRTLTRYEHVDI